MSTDSPTDLVKVAGESAVRSGVLEQLFDEAPDIAFFIKDQEGRYLAVNRSLATRHGFSQRTGLIGKRPEEVCPGPFGAVPTEQDRQVLKTGRALVNHLEMHWLQPNRPCWCLTTKLPLRNESGHVIGLVGFSRDLQEQVPLDDIPKDLALALEDFGSHLEVPISASQLAAKARMSPARFARLMKRVFGLTPTQYMAQTRINAACRLLRETERSVSEIALECGFCDHSAFTRAFRSAMGLTPSGYREHFGGRRP